MLNGTSTRGIEPRTLSLPDDLIYLLLAMKRPFQLTLSPCGALCLSLCVLVYVCLSTLYLSLRWTCHDLCGAGIGNSLGHTVWCVLCIQSRNSATLYHHSDPLICRRHHTMCFPPCQTKMQSVYKDLCILFS